MPALNRQDHYEVLGIAPTATGTEIKQAYHRLVSGVHPDWNTSPEATAQFQQVSNNGISCQHSPSSPQTLLTQRRSKPPTPPSSTLSHDEPLTRRSNSASYSNSSNTQPATSNWSQTRSEYWAQVQAHDREVARAREQQLAQSSAYQARPQYQQTMASSRHQLRRALTKPGTVDLLHLQAVLRMGRIFGVDALKWMQQGWKKEEGWEARLEARTAIGQIEAMLWAVDGAMKMGKSKWRKPAKEAEAAEATETAQKAQKAAEKTTKGKGKQVRNGKGNGIEKVKGRGRAKRRVLLYCSDANASHQARFLIM